MDDQLSLCLGKFHITRQTGMVGHPLFSKDSLKYDTGFLKCSRLNGIKLFNLFPVLPRKYQKGIQQLRRLGQNSKCVIFNRPLGKGLISDPVKKSSLNNVLVRKVCMLTIRQELLKSQLSSLKYVLLF